LAKQSSINTQTAPKSDEIAELRPVAGAEKQWVIKTPRASYGRQGSYMRRGWWTIGGVLAFICVFVLIFGANGIVPALQFFFLVGIPGFLIIRFAVFREFQRRKEQAYQDEHDMELDPANFMTLTELTADGTGFHEGGAISAFVEFKKKNKLGQDAETIFEEKGVMAHMLNSWHHNVGIQIQFLDLQVPNTRTDERMVKVQTKLSAQEASGARDLVQYTINQAIRDAEYYDTTRDIAVVTVMSGRKAELFDYIHTLQVLITQEKSGYDQVRYLNYDEVQELPIIAWGMDTFDIDAAIRKAYHEDSLPFRILWVEDQKGGVLDDFADPVEFEESKSDNVKEIEYFESDEPYDDVQTGDNGVQYVGFGLRSEEPATFGVAHDDGELSNVSNNDDSKAKSGGFGLIEDAEEDTSVEEPSEENPVIVKKIRTSPVRGRAPRRPARRPARRM